MAKKRQTRKKVTDTKKAATARQQTQAREIRKVRNVAGSAWKTYERAWAEDGVVKIQDKETGDVAILSPRDAALRAQAINKMLGHHKIPMAQREKALDFVTRMIEIIKEAKYQNENPSNKNEQLVANVLAGKTAEGKEIKPITDPEEMLQFLCFKYPMLSRDEIKQICNERLPQKDRIGIMQTINADRMMAFVQEHERMKQK